MGRIDLDTLLVRTSRTFALSIPQLPDPTRREVAVAYLLFRIADTFEDATRWSSAKQQRALRDFARLLGPAAPGSQGGGASNGQTNGEAPLDAEAVVAAWVAEPPLEHEGYLELLAHTPDVVAAFRELRLEAQLIIRRHVCRTAEGMARFVERAGDDHDLQLDDLEDLRDYRYVVAGIVGDMLTELFVLGREDLAPIAGYLAERARWFGEGLQLVNILKDRATDVTEGRSYLPDDVDRSALFELARADLKLAEEYSLALQRAGASRGLVSFTALPVLLAWATLERVETLGPGAKISRSDVARLVGQMDDALDADAPVFAEVPADRLPVM